MGQCALTVQLDDYPDGFMNHLLRTILLRVICSHLSYFNHLVNVTKAFRIIYKVRSKLSGLTKSWVLPKAEAASIRLYKPPIVPANSETSLVDAPFLKISRIPYKFGPRISNASLHPRSGSRTNSKGHILTITIATYDSPLAFILNRS